MNKPNLNPKHDFFIVERDDVSLYVHTERGVETFYFVRRDGTAVVVAAREIPKDVGGERAAYEIPKYIGEMFVTSKEPDALGAPSASGLRELLKAKGLTGAKAAEIVGVNSRTIRKWTGGERPIPNAAWKLLQLYSASGARDETESE